jgi:hypothetical protein
VRGKERYRRICSYFRPTNIFHTMAISLHKGWSAPMNQALNERRRAPRVQPMPDSRLSISVPLPVRVLDISRSGVLLGSTTELAVGEQAELRATVGSHLLSVVIEVRHVSTDAKARNGLRFRAGAVFVMLRAEERLLLEQMLGAEPA